MAVQPVSGAADIWSRILGAVVVILALVVVWALTELAVSVVPKDAHGNLAVTDVVAMVTGIGGLVVSIVGLFFGVSVAREGLNSATQANATSNNLAAAYQTQVSQNATFRANVAGGLTSLKGQVPQEAHGAIDNLLSQVQ
jgi:hypothetical protein